MAFSEEEFQFLIEDQGGIYHPLIPPQMINHHQVNVHLVAGSMAFARREGTSLTSGAHSMMPMVKKEYPHLYVDADVNYSQQKMLSLAKVRAS